jgi:hypothetical protein
MTRPSSSARVNWRPSTVADRTRARALKYRCAWAVTPPRELLKLTYRPCATHLPSATQHEENGQGIGMMTGAMGHCPDVGADTCVETSGASTWPLMEDIT